jgi:hypothetical protein
LGVLALHVAPSTPSYLPENNGYLCISVLMHEVLILSLNCITAEAAIGGAAHVW